MSKFASIVHHLSFVTAHLARRRVLSSIPVVAIAIAAAAAALSGCGIRGTAPDVGYTLLDGTNGRIADLRGKVVLVNFWATTCSVCVAEMPQLAATHAAFSGRGLQTLAVSMRYDAPAAVANFAESRRLPFDVAIDNTGAIAAAFGPIDGTPTTFLLDKRGAIVKRYVGKPDFDALNVLVTKLLTEG